MRKKLFLRLVPLMALVVYLQSCRTNEDLLTSKEEYYNSNKFQVFTSQDGKAINYSDGFKFLIGKYDSLNNTQYSKSAFLKKGNFDEDTAEYVEFNIHSQDIVRENGERWIFYPRIKSAAVSGIAVAILSNKEETVELRTLNPQSEYYGKVIDLFRAQYIKSILNLQKSNKGRGPGFPGQPPADIPPIVITIPNPGGGGGWTNPGGGDIPPKGCSKYQNCIADPDGAGGGGNNNDPQQNQDPCTKMKAQNSTPDFKAKVNLLETNLDLKKETGFVEKNNGTYEYKDDASTNSGSNSLTLGDPTPDMKGFLHTHVNDYTDDDGMIRLGFKIFSPADVIYFNQMVALAQQNGTPLGNIYAVMVSGTGTYQIRFTGNANQIKTVYTNTKAQYNEMYKEYFKQNSKRSNETNFLKFIDEQMYVKGLSLVKMNDDGTFTNKVLNSNKTDVSSIPCP